MPIVVPPAHVRVGFGRSSSALERRNAEGMIETTTETGEFAVGIDSTAFAELPFSIESGLVTEIAHRRGLTRALDQGSGYT
ncbi:MAG TPA: hypothetical protein VNO30_28860 [Kofleriaceae bacterium]|nr:hypothetical protein [Kofleriaceae bacterium]